MSALAVWTLLERELVRFFRDRARVIGAVAPPVLFWFLLGSALGPETLKYLYSGTLVLIVLFTSIFATISLIEDRREGFLQAVLVAPISRLSLVLGKVLGASAVGFIQGAAFLLMARLAGIDPGPAGYALATVALLLSSLALTGLGFCIAWKLDSTQGFHAVMNLFLIPMWLLSGAAFPAEGAAGWLRLLMRLNPVTYAVSALRAALEPGGAPPAGDLAALAAFAAATLAASFLVARKSE